MPKWQVVTRTRSTTRIDRNKNPISGMCDSLNRRCSISVFATTSTKTNWRLPQIALTANKERTCANIRVSLSLLWCKEFANLCKFRSEASCVRQRRAVSKWGENNPNQFLHGRFYQVGPRLWKNNQLQLKNFSSNCKFFYHNICLIWKSGSPTVQWPKKFQRNWDQVDVLLIDR